MVVKFWILGCYVVLLVSYFVFFILLIRDGNGVVVMFSLLEFRDYEVMGILMECREVWFKVK